MVKKGVVFLFCILVLVSPIYAFSYGSMRISVVKGDLGGDYNGSLVLSQSASGLVNGSYFQGWLGGLDYLFSGINVSLPISEPSGGGGGGYFPICGDGVCEVGENPDNCYEDCGSITVVVDEESFIDKFGEGIIDLVFGDRVDKEKKGVVGGGTMVILIVVIVLLLLVVLKQRKINKDLKQKGLNKDD